MRQCLQQVRLRPYFTRCWGSCSEKATGVSQPSSIPLPTHSAIPESFPHVSPNTVPHFVSPALHTARKQRISESVLRSQPCIIPIVPLRPAPTSNVNQHTSTPNVNQPTSTPIPVDLQDPKSVKAVTLIVEKVLQRLGYDGITITGQRKRVSNTKRSRETAIKVQQALMSPEQDCLWKVCNNFP